MYWFFLVVFFFSHVKELSDLNHILMREIFECILVVNIN